ncbi:alpha/beta fold hydrolase [Streptomyces mirabilis]|uniref:alpha/beta fold hydrolase n=1 Tax=Streptomyces mirabilis TaxID=68239 RepID=UPI0036A5BB1F
MTSMAGTLVAAVNKMTQWRAHMRAKSTTVNGYTFHYYEGGDGEPLVLLHGLADNRTSFLRSAAALTRRYRIILPDLPGHGANAADPGLDYSISGHVQALHGFLQHLGLEEFHLGGNSMGGHISAAYAIAHSGRVRSLILVNAPGLQVDDHLVYVGFGDRMKTAEDLDAVLARVYYRTPRLPTPVVRHLIEESDRAFEHTNAMVHAIRTGGDYYLNARVSEIRKPTLILWGRHDVVVRSNVAEAYKDAIRDSRLVFLEEGAHSPQLEIPGAVADAVTTFLDEVNSPAGRGFADDGLRGDPAAAAPPRRPQKRTLT